MKLIVKHGNLEPVKRHIISIFGRSSYFNGLYDSVRLQDGMIAGRDSYASYASSTAFTAGNGFEFIDATTEEGFIRLKELLIPPTPVNEPTMTNTRDRKPDKPTLGRCVIYNLNPALSARAIQPILFEAGHVWVNGRSRTVQFIEQRTLLVGNYYDEDSKMNISYGNPDGLNWPRFDAATELDLICQYFGVKARTVTLDMIVSPNLMNMIRTLPQDEMVAGFIRRDLQLVLPKEVQEAGADSILNWIMQEKKSGPAEPVQEPKRTSTRFEFAYDEIVTVKRILSRDDTVRIYADVPQSVLDRALEEGDSDLISAWIEDNRDRWVEIERIDGEESERASEETDSEYDGIQSYAPIEELFESLKQNQ